MTDLIWNTGTGHGTCLLDWFEVPNVDAAIATLEAAAGAKGQWEFTDDYGYNWDGLVGTFKGAVFTLYTHKSGTLKIGGTANSFLGPGEPTLDVAGLKAALTALLA
jgi:hypothetical protein